MSSPLIASPPKPQSMQSPVMATTTKSNSAVDLGYYSDDCLTEEEKDSFLYLAEIAWKKPTVTENGLSSSSSNFCASEAKEPNTFLSLFCTDLATDNDSGDDKQPLRKMVTRLQSIESCCSLVLTSLSAILQSLQRLQITYQEAALKTGSLHTQCDHLLAEQICLSDRLEELSSCLRYFADHDRLAARLNSPLVPVSPETYGSILDRLDQCISFFISSRHFKDGPAFENKYRELLSRAVGNIRNQVTTYIRATANFEGSNSGSLDVLTVSASGEEEEKLGVAYAFLYGRFRLAAFRVRPLVELLETRLERNPQEYGQAISECHEAYARQREALLSPVVAASISDIVSRIGGGPNPQATGVSNNCALLRAVGAFLRRLCQDEQQLYTAFFTHTTQHVDIMLTDLCSCLTDLFRPRIIHSRHVEALAEMCSTINGEMMDTQVSGSNNFETSSLYGFSANDNDISNETPLSGFESACRLLLQDIQERLVYASSQYIRDQILNYAPATGDVAYPEKLEMAKAIGGQQQQQAVLTLSPNPRLTSTPVPPVNPTAFPAIWYPTARRTITLLCRLHRCLDRTTLQGICQEALSACIVSLQKAAAQIRQAHPTTVDSHLFLIKHLLILREQLGPLHIDGVLRETSVALPDVGRRLMAAARGLVDNRSSILALSSNNALLRFMFESTPEIIERTIDSRQDLDRELRRACDEFISFSVHSIAGQVQGIVEKAQAFLNKQSGSPSAENLKSQPWGNPEFLRDASVELYRNLKVVYPRIREQLSLYIANADTERLLVRPIRTGVEFAVTDLVRLVLSPSYSEEERAIINCPTNEQLSLIFAA